MAEFRGIGGVVSAVLALVQEGARPLDLDACVVLTRLETPADSRRRADNCRRDWNQSKHGCDIRH